MMIICTPASKRDKKRYSVTNNWSGRNDKRGGLKTFIINELAKLTIVIIKITCKNYLFVIFSLFQIPWDV